MREYTGGIQGWGINGRWIEQVKLNLEVKEQVGIEDSKTYSGGNNAIATVCFLPMTAAKYLPKHGVLKH